MGKRMKGMESSRRITPRMNLSEVSLPDWQEKLLPTGESPIWAPLYRESSPTPFVVSPGRQTH